MALESSQGSQATSLTSDGGAAQGGGHEGGQEHSTDNASEGGNLDFKTLFENQREEFSQELGKRDAELGKTKSTIDKLRQALMDGDGEQRHSDPIDTEIAETEAELDRIIGIALESEKRGKPIPLTANTAIKSLQFKIKTLQDKKASSAELAELKAKVAQLSNPEVQIDQQAFSNLDQVLMHQLSSIYGPNENVENIFDAVSKDIVSEIRDLKKNDPKMWQRIARDKTAQTKMVAHFVKRAIPPRARELLEEDQIRRTPLSMDELQAAFQEAKSAWMQEKNPRKVEEMKGHMSKIRQQILSRMMEKHMGGASRTRMSELF